MTGAAAGCSASGDYWHANTYHACNPSWILRASTSISIDGTEVVVKQHPKVYPTSFTPIPAKQRSGMMMSCTSNKADLMAHMSLPGWLTDVGRTLPLDFMHALAKD